MTITLKEFLTKHPNEKRIDAFVYFNATELLDGHSVKTFDYEPVRIFEKESAFCERFGPLGPWISTKAIGFDFRGNLQHVLIRREK